MSVDLARRLGADARGVGALEFALVSPLLLLFIAGIIELAIWGVGAAAARDLAAQSARCIAVTPDVCASTAATRARLATLAPAVAANAELSFEKSPCGVLTILRYRRQSALGLPAAEGRNCAD